MLSTLQQDMTLDYLRLYFKQVEFTLVFLKLIQIAA
jgi:hypothetical protein